MRVTEPFKNLRIEKEPQVPVPYIELGASELSKIALIAAKIVLESKTIYGITIMDDLSEEKLRFLLRVRRGNSGERTYAFDNEYEERIALEKLCMYEMVEDYTIEEGVTVFRLTQKAKTYFKDKEAALIKYNVAKELQEFRKFKKYDVFISHANVDKVDYVDRLSSAVRRLGINVFYDTDVLSWGDHWKDVILEGTANSELAIIVISDHFFGREWTEKELGEFLNRQNDTGQKIVLPLLYNVTIEELKNHYPVLGEIQCISAENYSEEDVVILLAKELIKRYK